MPFAQVDGNVAVAKDSKPNLGMDLNGGLENLVPGIRAYYNNLISFDQMCKSMTTPTLNRLEEQISSAKKMHDHQNDLVERKRER